MSIDSSSLDALLRELVERQASDLHLKAMRPPLYRVNGQLLPLDTPPLTPDVIDRMLEPLIPEHLRGKMDQHSAVDFGYGLKGVSRFRASIYCQRGTRAGVFRRVPYDFPSLDEWGLPTVLDEMCALSQGLVLITGPTGSGKSSTLAALLKRIAETRHEHIVTIEDPIEFLISDNLCSVSQREIGIDTPDFATALRGILRQDPDVIMVGEMRDDETIRTVLAAAETGHLVLSTLHTNSAYQTIDRIMSSFSDSSHRQICQQLSSSLEAVVSMQLVPRADGEGMVAAVEILRRSPQISKLILRGELDSLYEEVESSVSYYRMQSMNQSLVALVLHGTITLETALSASMNPGDLDLMMSKIVGRHGAADPESGDAMTKPTSDFSEILKLQEISTRYDELKDRHGEEIDRREQEISELRRQLLQLSEQQGGENDRVAALEKEKQDLLERMGTQKAELETQVERLNARIRDLTAKAAEPPAETARRGLFRR